MLVDIEPGAVSIPLSQPALWTVPLAFTAMILASRPSSAPEWADEAVLRLHIPGRHDAEPPSARPQKSLDVHSGGH